MPYKHRVTIRVTRLEGRQGSLTSSNIIYCEDPSDLTIPLDTVLHSFPQTLVDAVAAMKPKKK